MPVTIVRILDTKLTDAFRSDSMHTLCDHWRAQGWVYSDEDAAAIPQILVHIGWPRYSMATSPSDPPLHAAAATAPEGTAPKMRGALVFPADKLILATAPPHAPPHRSVRVISDASCDVGDEWDGEASVETQTQCSGAARAGAQSARHRKRRLCKSLVEHDRNLRAAERGYEVRLVVMQPPSATPKNDVLVGWKATATTPGGAHALESWISVEEATGCAWADRDGDDGGA